jgi:hypothetical protein
MLDIRRRDRAAQGVTAEEERLGTLAAAQADIRADGHLAVVTLPHTRTATAADALCPELGGPAYETLLIQTPHGSTLYGPGRVIDALCRHRAGGWWGGDLPTRGYYGHPDTLDVDLVERLVRGGD